MGITQTEITLKNVKDGMKAEEGYIKPEEVRTATVTAVVDTGATHLVITEELFQKLGLEIMGERSTLCANGQRAMSKVVGPVEVQWKDRNSIVRAVVITGAVKVLLGAIPLEEMDLMVNPVTQELVGAHGDSWEILAL